MRLFANVQFIKFESKGTDIAGSGLKKVYDLMAFLLENIDPNANRNVLP